MKSFSKRVASFAMAAAMVCSLAVVSPVDAEAAAKPKFEKTRTAITAGTNYTYAVKNVTSKQYVKVYATTGIAVKYNNAKVTKGKTEIKGGKTIKVKINANNKVANYKGKVTVKVFNKKTNKKVKDLSDSFTVKCTKLAVTNVEPATMTGATHKYIVVNFNKALSSLDPSEVTIREKDTQRLVTVEKVALSADKKSATLTLLGDNSTSKETFVEANVDYVLTVTKSNATASMDFNFEAVEAGAVVSATDSAKSTITISNKAAVSLGTYTVPTSITVDYQDILGRTVTFWYNKNHQITKLVVADETPIYGAFSVVTDNDSNLVFTSKKDSNVKYTTNATTTATSTIYVTNATATTVVSGNKPDYVKLVLNPNGTIRSYQAVPMTNTILVESVSGKIVRQSKTTSASLDGYTIVKDGKTITIDQIVKGDVVVYDTNKKFAEVYNDSVSGVITSVTATKVTIDGKTYDYPNNTTAKYIKDDVDKTLDEKTLAGFMASKEAATLYFNRAGQIIFAAGKEAAVATNTTEYVLTQNAGNYGMANKHYLSLTGSNGTDKIGDVALDGLKFTLVDASQVVSGDVAGNGANQAASGNTVSFNGTWGTVTNATAGIITVSSNGSFAADICTVADIKELSVVSVTRDSKTNDIKEIKVEQPTVYTVSGDGVFKAGLGKITVDNGATAAEYKLSSSTPVYEVAKDNAVTKVEYSAFAKTTVKDKAGKVNVFLNGNNVSRIVIDNSNSDVYGVASDKNVTGVVTAFDYSNIDNNKVLVSLSVMDANGNTTAFASFSDNAKKAASSVSVGKIVTVKYAVDGEKNVADAITVDTTAAVGASGNLVRDNVVVESDGTTKYTLTENAKIVVINNNGTVKTISYSELQTMTNGKTFNMTVHKYSEGYVDFVIVKEDLT